MRFVTGMIVAGVLLIGMAAATALADVQPGDVIDKSNYEKIEGLVPDFLLDWVKKGDLTMKIGALTYDPKEFWSPEVLENRHSNQKRYKVDEHNGIIDTTTGKKARGIVGFPFPEPDTSDPTLATQILWNRLFMEYFLQGNVHEMQAWLSVTRGGLEKTYILENASLILDPSKSEQDYAQISVFREPFNMAGTGSLAIFPLYPPDPGIRYAYAPELRRVKRLSHRLSGSDVMFGLDQAPDDSWAGGPKTNFDESINRFIEEKDALAPYYAETPLTVPWNEAGGLDVGPKETGVVFKAGYETPGWQGAPWNYPDLIWVKTRAYVFESRSTTSSYGYGPCEGWIDKGSFVNLYKRITDPNGQLWKGAYWPTHAIGTPDGKYRMVDNFASVIVDMRRDHGSTFPYAYYPKGFKKILIQNPNESLFTRAGFVKFSQ